MSHQSKKFKVGFIWVTLIQTKIEFSADSVPEKSIWVEKSNESEAATKQRQTVSQNFDR